MVKIFARHIILLLTLVMVSASLRAKPVGNDSLALQHHSTPESLAPHSLTTTQPADSADVSRLSHRSFWRASAETVGMNLGLWAFDRYVQKGHFAYISWETIKENFRHGFEWDNDHLSTNMFAHPYNGSIYYNAGRSNGFNYWQSALFAVGGSAMWEMFMEREYPSTNDIIATPIGGTAIGEVLYRTSDMIIDDSSTGWERFGRELAGFVISPARGFTRIVTGRAWQHRSTSGRRFGLPPTSVTLSVGGRLLLMQGSISDENSLQSVLGGFTTKLNIEYGDRFAGETRFPFDYFIFSLDADVMKDQPALSRLEIIGRLLSKSLIDNHNTTITLGLYQHYDYFDSDTVASAQAKLLYPCSVPYKFGTPASIGGGLQFLFAQIPFVHLDAYAHANAVIMGGILSDFYRYYHRNYNWGSGFSLKGGIAFRIPKFRLRGGADVRMYRIYTWDGRKSNPDFPPDHPDNIQGDRSNATFFNLAGHIDYRLYNRLYASVMLDWYRRYTNYPGRRIVYPYPEGGAWLTTSLVTSNQFGLKLMLYLDL